MNSVSTCTIFWNTMNTWVLLSSRLRIKLLYRIIQGNLVSTVVRQTFLWLSILDDIDRFSIKDEYQRFNWSKLLYRFDKVFKQTLVNFESVTIHRCYRFLLSSQLIGILRKLVYRYETFQYNYKDKDPTRFRDLI